MRGPSEGKGTRKGSFESSGIALAAHPYAGRAAAPQTAAWDRAFGYLSDSYPVLLTEIGFDPCDEIVPGECPGDA